MPSEKAQHLPRQSKGTQLEVKSQLFNTVSAEQPVSVNIFHGEKEESVIQKWQNSSKKQWMESGAFTTPAAPKVSQNCAHSVVLLLHDTHLCSQSYLRICIHRNLNTHFFFFAHNCRTHYCLHSRYSCVLQVELLWASDQSRCDSKRRVNLLMWHLP